MSGEHGNCGEKGAGGATVDDAAVNKPKIDFIAGLKRLAKERRAANDGGSRERVAAAAPGGETDKLDGGNRDQLGRAACRTSNPAADEDGAGANGSAAANDLKVEDIPDMTGKIISVSTENQPLRSASNQPQSKQQQRRRDDTKQRSKKKSSANPKKKPTSTSQLEDGSLPDMTGKEILVEQVELPSIEPVKEEIDLDDLILEEQSSSTNKRRSGSVGTSKSVNRRGPMSKNRSQKSTLTNSTTSEGTTGGSSRCQLFATYNDQSQKSLQTQTTVGTSGQYTHDDSDSPQNQQQIPEPPQVSSSCSPYSNRIRPVNSRRDRGVTSLHSSLQHSKPTLGKIPSGKILPDVDEEVQTKSSLDISSKSMPSRAQSWANLIAMDEQSKRASMEAMEMEDVEEEESYIPPSFNPRKTSAVRTSQTSIVTEGSVNSRGSRESGSRRSKHSKRSDCDDLSRNRRRQQAVTSETSWKNESTMSVLPALSQMKDPEYIRTQATERFERGLEYAELGKLDAARDRFLVALRYRVMDRGSLHPDVAATHEMLGFVEYFIAENEKNDNFEGNLVRLDEGDDGLLGGNLTIMGNPDKDSQALSSSRGKSRYEKAAMHFQTALDILDAKELVTNNEKASTLTNDAPSKDETTFQWKELAETYSVLDEKGRLGVEERIDIVSRIQDRMDELPVTVGEKSYATSFLSSFNE